MSQRQPIDWSKIIIDRAPPVKRRPRRPPVEPEVYDLFGPDETPDPKVDRHGRPQLAS